MIILHHDDHNHIPEPKMYMVIKYLFVLGLLFVLIISGRRNISWENGEEEKGSDLGGYIYVHIQARWEFFYYHCDLSFKSISASLAQSAGGSKI
jgi:hypothetical protein